MRSCGLRFVTWAIAAILPWWLTGSVPQAPGAEINAPEGWSTRSPREEIRPDFAYLPDGGPNGTGSFVIEGDGREGANGWWEKTSDVQGGHWYRFRAVRKATNVDFSRRAAVARILWRNSEGRSVMRDEPSPATYLPGTVPPAQPEFPPDGETDVAGWTVVSGVYRAPSAASRATLELAYRWEAKGRIEWADVSLEETDPLPPRKVRLATVHYQPREGKTAEEKCRQFGPLIEEAARQQADLVVLPETLTFYRSGRSYFDCA